MRPWTRILRHSAAFDPTPTRGGASSGPGLLSPSRRRARAGVAALAVIFLAGSLAAACGSGASSGAASRPAGSVRGTLLIKGGTISPICATDGSSDCGVGVRPMSGTVTLSAPGRKALTIRVGQDGLFSISGVATGTYHVVGDQGLLGTGCPEASFVKVEAHKTADVSVLCVIPDLP
jgi:hypothetical protein